MQASKSRQRLGSFLLGTTILLLVLVLMLALLHPLLSSLSSLSSSGQRPPASVHLQLPVVAAPTSSTLSVPETPSAATKSPVPVATAQSAAAVAKTSAPGTPCQSAGWYAQLGAFFTPAQAEKLARRAARSGQPVCIGKHPQQRLYRVLAGPSGADRAAARNVAEGFIRSKISPHAYPQYWSPTP
ncbi:SPOR domain-containing protein [Candidatus Igneacidithiobacillus taiwanensis]|uniref:SPOR domain-containing protein n=1 Tax=Candidatus Igneacidithiobacillus taiwanensis TaxID=1945924 RepID=UPI00289EC1A7|nr:SPOR domain-containing protein [Candidatus Igneacidithiobacillus taiwanensis]MCE5359553.1 SPOR domain-containing protein [Acidithiobacillus sp.]